MADPPSTPPEPTEPTPPPPIKAPVGFSDVNSLDTVNVVTRHLSREYHWKAPTAAYKGETDDDRRVAGAADATGAPIPKATLNAAFFETGIATVEITVPKGEDFYMRWWLEDDAGNLVAEHPRFSKAHFDSKDAKAKLATAKYGWRWDGRFTNTNGRRIFLRNKNCTSRVQIKSKTKADIPAGSAATAVIQVQGEPYKVLVLGVPKTDAQLEAEMAGRGGGRWLHTDGARLATDCWIKIYRGIAAEPAPEGSAVFLGHGAIEATEYKTTLKDGVVRNGAIATPHDITFRAWVRHRRFNFQSGPFDVSLCEIANVAPTANQDWLITLPQPAGMPPANNPFCDSNPNQAFKDGVQGHRSFNQGGAFLIDDASVGCTTIFDLRNGKPAKPASEIGTLKSIRASYGEWDGTNPTKAAQKNKLWGPPLEGGRPGSFYNKQNKRPDTKDVELEDSIAKPLIQPRMSVTDTTHFDEPLHMQPTFQHGLFGGFLAHEVAYSQSIADEPDAAGVVDPQMRIRCLLKSAPENSKAWQYHRLPAFGHRLTGTAAKPILELWVPRLVQRLWNGNLRNVLIGEWNGSRFSLNHGDYAWYFEQRDTGGVATNRGYIGTKPKAGSDLTPLDEISYLKRPVKLPTLAVADIKAGARLFSVFKYRIKLLPTPATGSSVWTPLTGRLDLFSGPLIVARIIDEQVTAVGTDSYLVGQSELELLIPPPTST